MSFFLYFSNKRVKIEFFTGRCCTKFVSNLNLFDILILMHHDVEADNNNFTQNFWSSVLGKTARKFIQIFKKICFFYEILLIFFPKNKQILDNSLMLRYTWFWYPSRSSIIPIHHFYQDFQFQQCKVEKRVIFRETKCYWNNIIFLLRVVRLS